MQTLSTTRRLITMSGDRLWSAARFVGRLGFGRQAALVAGRTLFPARAHTPARRTASLAIGTLLIGTAVALITQARLGMSPYDVLVDGLLPRLGLTFGQTVWVVSAVLFLLAAVLGQRPSRWGIAYVIATGFAIDIAASIVNAPDSLLARYGFVAAALAFLSAGISLIVHSGCTGGAFELLTLAGEARGLDRRMIRTSLEVGVLVVGVLLGGNIGPATVIIAVLIGPMLGVFGQALADHSAGRSMRREPLRDEVPHELVVVSAD